jgi:pyruvate formate lyase activating enzyme
MTGGLIFNIQKYSVHDGPGIRTTVFLKGCPLDCLWCHNPESISPRREIIVMENRCMGCALCRAACPHGKTGAGPLPPRPEVCDLCGACVQACPTGGRQIVGREMSVDEVLNEVLKDQVFYQESGGGVTFSGGEPLAQPEFLRTALEACRQHSLHTAVDTSGFASRENLLSIAPLTDLFLYDVKVMDDAKHREYTGVSNTLILKNLKSLAQAHRRIWLRVPVIPGLTDDTANLEAIAQLAASIPAVEQVNLLPFHATGAAKSERLGRQRSVGKLTPPSDEAMAQFAEIFAKFGVVAKIGG